MSQGNPDRDGAEASTEERGAYGAGDTPAWELFRMIWASAVPPARERNQHATGAGQPVAGMTGSGSR